MRSRLGSVLSVTWRGAIALLTLEIAAVSILRYFTSYQAAPPPILANAFANPFLVLHVAAGVTALVVGPFQFVERIRASRAAIHRATGLVYVGACVVAAPAGFMLAMGTTAGSIAATGFAIPALLWPVFTYFGLRLAMERRFDEHREWMFRSYAITSTAITLRLMLPFAGLVLGLPFHPAYQAIAWLSWMTNLAICELYIRGRRTSPEPQRTLATA